MIKNPNKKYVIKIYYYFIIALFFTLVYGQIFLQMAESSPFIHQYRIIIMVTHGLIYLFIFFNWPGLVSFLYKQAGVPLVESLRKKIISSRNMLIVLFIFQSYLISRLE